MMRGVLLLLALCAQSALAQLMLKSASNTSSVKSASRHQVFQVYKPSIYQVRSVRLETGQKAAIGSGFLVGDGSFIATNYHVIAPVLSREGFGVDYVDTEQNQGKLQIVAVDVINDLALLKAESALGKPFPFAQHSEQGDTLFSLGNPNDLGFSIVEGSSNGMQQNTSTPRLLFSGSINPGMSGGPTVNENGEVVGVNVATQGNGIGFIVPVEYLQTLLNDAEQQSALPSADDLNAKIAAQLMKDNERYYQRFLDKKLKTGHLGNYEVPMEISDDIRCWDNSQEPEAEDLVLVRQLICANDRTIFLNDDVQLGDAMFIYSEYYARESLPSARFYRLYSKDYFISYTRRMRRDYGDFRCQADFINVAGRGFKGTYCVQPSKKYTQGGEALVDAYFVAADVNEKNQGFIVDLMFTGIQESLAKPVMANFLEQIKWNADEKK